MRELPKYAFLTSEEITGIKIIQLERPHIIASVHDYKRDNERVEDYMEAMAQERFPIAKVKGYTIFLTVYTSLTPNNNADFQRAVLNEMAEYFLTARIQKKPGVYMKCEESGRTEKRIVQEGHRRKRIKEMKKQEEQ